MLATETRIIIDPYGALVEETVNRRFVPNGLNKVLDAATKNRGNSAEFDFYTTLPNLFNVCGMPATIIRQVYGASKKIRTLVFVEATKPFTVNTAFDEDGNLANSATLLARPPEETPSHPNRGVISVKSGTVENTRLFIAFRDDAWSHPYIISHDHRNDKFYHPGLPNVYDEGRVCTGNSYGPLLSELTASKQEMSLQDFLTPLVNNLYLSPFNDHINGQFLEQWKLILKDKSVEQIHNARGRKEIVNGLLKEWRE